MTDQEIALQRRAARLVSQEVHACMSSLVATLARSNGAIDRNENDLAGLVEQAAELSYNVLDYESAASEAGAHIAQRDDGLFWLEGLDPAEGNEGYATAAEAASDYCSFNDIEPHECEVYEHWAVSSWLAEKLIAKGERVDTDFAGLNVWARTTTGQAISADSVIEAITTETGYASGGEA